MECAGTATLCSGGMPPWLPPASFTDNNLSTTIVISTEAKRSGETWLELSGSGTDAK